MPDHDYDFAAAFDEIHTAGLHQVRQLDTASRALCAHLGDDLPVPLLLALTRELRECAALALGYSHYLLPLRHANEALCPACAAEEEEQDEEGC